MEPAFNSTVALSRLSTLTNEQCLLVGLACCERMYPNYVAFAVESAQRDPTILRKELDAAWSVIDNSPATNPPRNGALKRVLAAIPHSDSDEGGLFHATMAQDSGAALCHVIQFIVNSKRTEISAIHELSTNSVDWFLQEQLQLDMNIRGNEQVILAHPVMQQELLRQIRDIEFARTSPSAAGIGEFKKLAANENITVVTQ